jgi:hypothetical protein
MSKSTPAMNSFRPIGFFTLAGVANADVQEDQVVGVQKNPLPEFRAPEGVVLCAIFANWPNHPEGVLRFTRYYGALRAPLTPGATFSFRIRDWHEDQSRIRSAWDMIRYISEKFGLADHGDFQQETIPVEKGEELIQRPGKLEYKAQSLFRLLWLEFASIPLERLRKCVRPRCQTPYFVAMHLGQRYCSDTCSRWAQREWKKAWWNSRGADWRHRKAKAKAEAKAKAKGKRLQKIRKTKGAR